MKKLVTIVVLTYNNLNLLDNAIKSIFKQSYSDIEIVINDDSSKDFNYDIVKEMFKCVPTNIKNVIINSNKINLGTVKNFNNAIKISSGDIIIPLSCDDEFADSHVVQKIKEFFDKNNCLICTGKRIAIDENGNATKILPSKEQLKYLNSKTDVTLRRMYMSNIVSGASTYYRRDLFEKYGLFNEEFRLLEDYPYYINLLINGEKIHFLDYITIRYKLGGVSSNKVRGTVIYEDFKKVYEKVIFPQRNIIGMKQYRETKLDYYRKYYKEEKVKYIFAHFIYFEAVFCKLIRRKILKRV